MRYKEYKKVDIPWLDEVPSHWEIIRAKNLYKKENRPTRDEDEVITCFRDGQVTLRKNRRTTGFTESILEHGYQGVRKGDLVIHVMDAFAGAIGVSDSDGKSTPVYNVCNGKIALCNEYYAYLLRIAAKKGYIQSLYKGIRERSSDFRFDTFQKIILPVPPKEEQEQMARFLDWKINEIDGLILNKKEKLNSVDNYFKINIFKMFDRLNNEEIPLKRILSEKMTDGPHETPTFVSDGIPFVSVEAVENGRINLSKKRGFISRETSEIYRKKIKPQKEDIFIVKSGSTTGKIAYVDFDDEFDIWSPLALVRVKKNINKKYIFYYLSSELFQQQIKDNWTFGTQPNIGMSTLINLKIKIPSKQEQDFLANNIESINNRIETIKYNITKQINNLKLLKQSLISDVVTGKIDVRNVSIPEYNKVIDMEEDINLEENFNEEV